MTQNKFSLDKSNPLKRISLEVSDYENISEELKELIKGIDKEKILKLISLFYSIKSTELVVGKQYQELEKLEGILGMYDFIQSESG